MSEANDSDNYSVPPLIDPCIPLAFFLQQLIVNGHPNVLDAWEGYLTRLCHEVISEATQAPYLSWPSYSSSTSVSCSDTFDSPSPTMADYYNNVDGLPLSQVGVVGIYPEGLQQGIGQWASAVTVTNMDNLCIHPACLTLPSQQENSVIEYDTDTVGSQVQIEGDDESLLSCSSEGRTVEESEPACLYKDRDVEGTAARQRFIRAASTRRDSAASSGSSDGTVVENRKIFSPVRSTSVKDNNHQAKSKTSAYYDPEITHYLKSVFYSVFGKGRRLNKELRDRIQKRTGLEPRKITYWFSNHKRRFRKELETFKQLESEGIVSTYDDFVRWQQRRENQEPNLVERNGTTRKAKRKQS